MKQPCSDNQIIIKYASVGIWRQINIQSSCLWTVISYSLGTIELSSKCQLKHCSLSDETVNLTSFIGSCYPVCHKKKWNVEWINAMWKQSLWMRSSMIPFLLPLVTFGRDFLTRQQIQNKEKPSGKAHGSDFPFPCSLCHPLPQRLSITVCDYPQLLISWGWSHSSNSSRLLGTRWRGRRSWARQLC